MLNIPSIIGATVDEGMIFVAGAFPNPVTNLQYRAVVKAITKDESRQIVEQYPPLVSVVLVKLFVTNYDAEDISFYSVDQFYPQIVTTDMS